MNWIIEENTEKSIINLLSKELNVDPIISSMLVNRGIKSFEQAKDFRKSNTHKVSTYTEFKDIIKNKGGFIRCGWDGTSETENAIKNETKATIRVIPFDEKTKDLNCIFSGKPAKHEVIFAKAY